MTSKTVRNIKYKIVSVAFDRYKSYDFVTDKYLDEYLEGEEIDIPGDDKATIVGTRKGTLKYDLCYPYYFDFKYYYKTVDGVSIKLESYVLDNEAYDFKKQRYQDYKEYEYLKDKCDELEGKLLFKDY